MVVMHIWYDCVALHFKYQKFKIQYFKHFENFFKYVSNQHDFNHEKKYYYPFMIISLTSSNYILEYFKLHREEIHLKIRDILMQIPFLQGFFFIDLILRMNGKFNFHFKFYSRYKFSSQKFAFFHVLQNISFPLKYSKY